MYVKDTALLFYCFPKKKKKKQDHKYNLRARKLRWAVSSRSNFSVQTKRTSECKRRRENLHYTKCISEGLAEKAQHQHLR